MTRKKPWRCRTALQSCAQAESSKWGRRRKYTSGQRTASSQVSLVKPTSCAPSRKRACWTSAMPDGWPCPTVRGRGLCLWPCGPSGCNWSAPKWRPHCNPEAHPYCRAPCATWCTWGMTPPTQCNSRARHCAVCERKTRRVRRRCLRSAMRWVCAWMQPHCGGSTIDGNCHADAAHCPACLATLQPALGTVAAAGTHIGDPWPVHGAADAVGGCDVTARSRPLRRRALGALDDGCLFALFHGVGPRWALGPEYRLHGHILQIIRAGAGRRGDYPRCRFSAGFAHCPSGRKQAQPHAAVDYHSILGQPAGAHLRLDIVAAQRRSDRTKPEPGGLSDRGTQHFVHPAGDRHRSGPRLSALHGAANLYQPGKNGLASVRSGAGPGRYALGAYYIPELLGGGKQMMIGSLIQSQFGVARNWPFGSALAFALLSIVLAGMLLYTRRFKKALDT